MDSETLGRKSEEESVADGIALGVCACACSLGCESKARLSRFRAGFWVLPLVGLIACGKGPDSDHGHAHDHETETAVAHEHEHVPPHGGAAVVLGEERFHLEFVLDEVANELHCYVLDGHMENFVRIEAPVIPIEFADETVLQLEAVASRATGETVGDSAHFKASVDWAATRKNFAAVVKELTVKGNRFENVSFRYPEGNE